MVIATLPENQERRLSRMVNGVSATNIIIHVGVFVKQNNLGILTGPDTGYQLDELRVRLPSLFEGPPDLAVEIVSSGPSTRTIMSYTFTRSTAAPSYPASVCP